MRVGGYRKEAQPLAAARGSRVPALPARAESPAQLWPFAATARAPCRPRRGRACRCRQSWRGTAPGQNGIMSSMLLHKYTLWRSPFAGDGLRCPQSARPLPPAALPGYRAGCPLQISFRSRTAASTSSSVRSSDLKSPPPRCLTPDTSFTNLDARKASLLA